MAYDGKILLEYYSFPNYRTKYKKYKINLYNWHSFQREWFSPKSTNLIMCLLVCDTNFSLKPYIKLGFTDTELLLEISLFANFLHFSFLKE